MYSLVKGGNRMDLINNFVNENFVYIFFSLSIIAISVHVLALIWTLFSIPFPKLLEIWDAPKLIENSFD